MGIHDGHRDRLRKLFEEKGADAFNDITLLELLLFYAIPRKDANPIAHKLLDHFGSLYDVMNASIQELMEVEGIGYNTAVFLTLIPQMTKRAEISRTKDIIYINKASEAGAYFKPRLESEPEEVLLLLCLNNQNKVICCKEMSRGTVNAVEINIARIVETAIKAKAASVILAHNHPGARPIPSIEDDYFTKSVYRALKMVSIELRDHIVVGENLFVSFQDYGMMRLCEM